MDNNRDTKEKTIRKRIKKEKELLLEQLKKTPIVQLACGKIGIGRATYYRWRKDDSRFSSLADGAIHEGSLLINDMTESQLLSAIKDRNMTAIIFWLKHHHPAYETRVEIRAAANPDNENLTERQKAIIKEALAHTTLGQIPEICEKEDENEKKTK